MANPFSRQYPIGMRKKSLLTGTNLNQQAGSNLMDGLNGMDDGSLRRQDVSNYQNPTNMLNGTTLGASTGYKPEQEEGFNPFFMMRGAANTASFLSGIVDRGRQNQYMYDQYSTLGQIPGMPVEDFQPVANNPYFAVGGSVLDYTKASGRNSSFAGRKALAEELGITGYRGTADQNMKLLTMLREQDGTPHFIHGTQEEASHTETEGDVDYRLRDIENKYAQYQRTGSKRSFRPQAPSQQEAPQQPRSLQRGYTPNINDQDYLGILNSKVPLEKMEDNLSYLNRLGRKNISIPTESSAKEYDWFDRNITNPLEKKGVNTDAIKFGLNGASYATMIGEGALLAKNAPALLRLASMNGAKALKTLRGIAGNPLIDNEVTLANILNNPVARNAKKVGEWTAKATKNLPKKALEILGRLESNEIPFQSTQHAVANLRAYNGVKEAAQEAAIIKKLALKNLPKKVSQIGRNLDKAEIGPVPTRLGEINRNSYNMMKEIEDEAAALLNYKSKGFKIRKNK